MGSKGPSLRLCAKPSLIRALMAIHGITSYYDLADRAGVGRETTRAFIVGRMVDTSVDIANRLSKALKVKTDWLFIELRTALPSDEIDEVAA